MIEIKNLYKEYDKGVEVLRNCSLTIKKGSIIGIIGVNGSGKSTLFRLIAGVYKPNEGEVLVGGENVFDNIFAKRKIFFLSDDPFYDFNVTPKKLALLYSSFYNLDMKVLDDLLNSFRIETTGNLSAFSKGMRRQVFVSLAIACKPDYLLLDESFDGLDPLSRVVFKKAIINLNIANSTTVIISSHSLREIEDICDSFGIIENKKVILSGDVIEEVNKLFKYQLVFDKNINKDHFEDFEILSFLVNGKVIEIVLRGDHKLIEERIDELNPLVKEQLDLTLEELFIYEVNKGK